MFKLNCQRFAQVAKRITYADASRPNHILGGRGLRFSSSETNEVQLKRGSGALGAIFTSGIDLRSPSDKQDQLIRDALLQHKVLVIRDQDISPGDLLNFGKIFGEAEVHPIVKGRDDYPEVLEWSKHPGKPTDFGESWHTDNSFQIAPTGETCLHGVVIPPWGNDTLFCNTAMAYDALSSGMKGLLQDLKAVHIAAKAYNLDSDDRKDRFEGKGDRQYDSNSADLHREVEQPVVRTHAKTGEKVLYVNSMFTERFVGFTKAESEPILKFLIDHMAKPEFHFRVQWEPNTVVVWDNPCTQHIAINDNFEHLRTMRRVTVQGTVPV